MSDNPLKQYFRRPAIFYKLPTEGRFYQPGVVEIPPNGELPIYPMTTMDELSLRTPDALFNGSAVAQVIQNCVPAVKDAWKLTEIDSDALIVAIRAASVDGKLEIESTCPKCEKSSDFIIDLMRLLSEKQQNISFEDTLDIGELTFKFRPLTFAETNANAMRQFDIQRMLAQLDAIEDGPEKQKVMADSMEKLSDMLLEVIAQTIEYIKTPETTVREHEFITEFMKECDTKTNNAIKDFSAKIRKANSDRPIEVKCTHCEHEYKQPLELNFTNFFE